MDKTALKRLNKQVILGAPDRNYKPLLFNYVRTADYYFFT